MINNKRCLVYPDFVRHTFHQTEKKCVSKSMSCFRFTLKISIQVCLALAKSHTKNFQRSNEEEEKTPPKKEQCETVFFKKEWEKKE